MVRLGSKTLVVGLAACALAAGGIARAQTTFTYSDVPGVFQAIDGSTTCGAPLVRTFSVPDTYTVADVDIGVLADHFWRADIRMTLQSPLGTRITFATGAGGSADNLNVRFDDEASATYAANNTNPHGLTAPPYQFTNSPQAVLSGFDGEAVNGTWRLEICDTFPGADDGNYRRGDLYITESVPMADLSVAVSASTTNPTVGANTTITVQVSNAGPVTATGVTVFAQLPPGLSYVSDTGGGAYNSVTGVWTLPAGIASGGSSSLQIVASANPSGSGSFIAEVQASGLPDPDSTPNNRATAPTEDDTASINIIVNGPPPGTAPTLTCPVATSVFDWDTNNWPAGSLSQNYTVGATPFAFSFTGDTGFFQNNAVWGGQAPITNNFLTGGLTPAENALLFVLNYPSSSSQVLVTANVGTAGIGVEGLQFSAFDVDENPNTSSNVNFIDRLRVFGFLSGSAVTPVLTQGVANTVSGTTATGIAGAASTSADGTVVITFLEPVDEVRIFYDNDPAVAANPGQQGISIHDLTFCPRGYDYSDALAAYGSPAHLISDGIRLGAQDPDRESAAQPGVNADGDDTTGAPDDEDGVTFPTLTRGATVNVTAAVNGLGGYLQAWIDFNGNNSFGDAGEQVAVNLQDTDGDGQITAPVSVPVTATTGQAYARFRWSTTPSVNATALAPDGEVEDYAITFSGAALMDGGKTVTVWDPASAGLFAVPGNDVIYAITSMNTGSGPVDAGSIEIIDHMPAEITFYNGDIDDAGPETNPVSFAQANGAALTFTYATDVGYSNSATAPANFAACTYSPTAGYDPNVTFVCFNPKGALTFGSPDPEFTVQFRARIK